MNTFKERISHFARQKYDAGWTNFEKLVGLSSGTIAKMGAYGLTMRQLAKVAEKCPELNLRWLRGVEGADSNTIFQSNKD